MNELLFTSMQPPKSSGQSFNIDPDMSEASVPALPDPDESTSGKLLADGIEQGKTLLNEHKGKLAIGVAATLGLMVFYKWREKKLAEEEPEEYARLQRIKAVVREEEANANRTAARPDDDE